VNFPPPLPQSRSLNGADCKGLSVPLLADFVAKVVGGHIWGKNRITIADAANRSCAAAVFGESMLRGKARKILLQQYLHEAAVTPLKWGWLFKGAEQTSYARLFRAVSCQRQTCTNLLCRTNQRATLKDLGETRPLTRGQRRASDRGRRRALVHCWHTGQNHSTASGLVRCSHPPDHIADVIGDQQGALLVQGHAR
jgi:hypothetical protein